jgi:hypothetical protein
MKKASEQKIIDYVILKCILKSKLWGFFYQ